MGNFSSKDGHSSPGPPLDMFHTPPVSPVTPPPTCTSGRLQLASPLQGSSPEVKGQTHKEARDIPATSSPGNLDAVSSLNINQDWAVISSGSCPSPVKAVNIPSVKKETFGRSGPKASSFSSSTVFPSSARTSSPVKPAETPYLEKDSGLGPSLAETSSGPGSPCIEENLLEQCRKALGLKSSTDSTPSLTDLLQGFLTEREQLVDELRTLRESIQTERGDWQQFQADLQVAVAVADRLRAEAEEELSTLRETHQNWQRQLADAHRAQKEAEGQLEPLRVQLEDIQQRLVTLTETQTQNEAQSQSAHTGGSREHTQTQAPRGRERGASGKGVAEGYLRSLAAEERRREEPRRSLTSERSRSLSRLPVSSDSTIVLNGTSQTTTSAGLVSKGTAQVKGRRGQDKQENVNNNHSGKQEESNRQPISDLTDSFTVTTSKSRVDGTVRYAEFQSFTEQYIEFQTADYTVLGEYWDVVLGLRASGSTHLNRPQDDFNRLLRRHGGSKRNSLLRWCQSRTHGYKNIEITNFSSSWSDGLAFCAVYHTYLPSHIPYSSLSPDSKRENLTLAFQTGEGVGITASLTVDEMLRADGPDWQRVLGYVESIYRHFEM